MEIEIKIDKEYTEPKIIIMTDKITEDISRLMKQLQEESPKILTGFKNGRAEIIAYEDIIHIYAASGKVFAVTKNGEYILKRRLYELEEILDKTSFIRISNSEIINLKSVKSFDLSISGTIRVSFSDGSASYASRRYISKIKSILGI